MNLPPTPRNLARSAAMRNLPRHKGFDAAFDAVFETITADPTWEADFTAATQPPAPAPVRRALAVNLTDTRADNLAALDGLFTAAQEARRALNAASAALDAARAASAAADEALAAAYDAARAR